MSWLLKYYIICRLSFCHISVSFSSLQKTFNFFVCAIILSVSAFYHVVKAISVWISLLSVKKIIGKLRAKRFKLDSHLGWCPPGVNLWTTWRLTRDTMYTLGMLCTCDIAGVASRGPVIVMSTLKKIIHKNLDLIQQIVYNYLHSYEKF